MLGPLVEAFWSPEVGGTALDALTIYLAHAGLGAVLAWGLAAALDRADIGAARLLALLVVALGYAGWEWAQITYAGGGIADGVADWIGVVALATAGIAAFERDWLVTRWAAAALVAGGLWSLAQFLGG